MCKIFLSSLGPMAIRWFDGLDKKAIHKYDELIRTFGARFVTCSRVPKPFDSLITMSMKEGETLRAYSNRYWELYNKIGEKFCVTDVTSLHTPISSFYLFIIIYFYFKQLKFITRFIVKCSQTDIIIIIGITSKTIYSLCLPFKI